MENKNLTIFVLTCSNNPNYEACLEALSNQTMTAKIEIIKNVYPISNAFQEMFDRCKTRYAVQKMYNLRSRQHNLFYVS